jgi:hypothetical protein
LAVISLSYAHSSLVLESTAQSASLMPLPYELPNENV